MLALGGDGQGGAGVPVAAAMVNCTSPESVTEAVKVLTAVTSEYNGEVLVGGHANGFTQIPEDWRVETAGIAALGVRRDLTPRMYSDMAKTWISEG